MGLFPRHSPAGRLPQGRCLSILPHLQTTPQLFCWGFAFPGCCVHVSIIHNLHRLLVGFLLLAPMHTCLFSAFNTFSKFFPKLSNHLYRDFTFNLPGFCSFLFLMLQHHVHF